MGVGGGGRKFGPCGSLGAGSAACAVVDEADLPDSLQFFPLLELLSFRSWFLNHRSLAVYHAWFCVKYGDIEDIVVKDVGLSRYARALIAVAVMSS